MRRVSWPTVRLEEVCEHITVGHVGPMVNQYVDSGVPFLRSQNVRPFRFDPTELKFISPTFHAKLKKSALRPMDVVVTRSGANTGQCCIIPQELADANCSDLVIMRPSEKINPWYLMYVLNSDWGRAKIAGGVVGAAQHHFNIGVARIFPIQLPPLPIQRRIAGILSAYDELIENSQRRIKILESMARALYREWFVHFRFPGHESVPRVPSPLGDIPKGWEGTMGDVAMIDRDGINPFQFPNEQFEHFSIPAYDVGRTPAVEAGETIRSSKYCIDNSCVLLSKLNPRIPRVWLPSPSGTLRAITSTEFLVLKPKTGFSREFLYSKCCSDEFAGHFVSLAIGTSTSHQRVRPENVLAMPSTVPTKAIVEQFTNHVAPMLAASEGLRTTVQNLRRTRDLLLPRLLSGQIDVEAIAS